MVCVVGGVGVGVGVIGVGGVVRVSWWHPFCAVLVSLVLVSARLVGPCGSLAGFLCGVGVGGVGVGVVSVKCRWHAPLLCGVGVGVGVSGIGGVVWLLAGFRVMVGLVLALVLSV